VVWGSPVVSWFINPHNYSYLRTINHSEIGVMCTNLAIERGPHFVYIDTYYRTWFSFLKWWCSSSQSSEFTRELICWFVCLKPSIFLGKFHHDLMSRPHWNHG
jgi:hypothetical protein